ncbi:MAG: hypothetical protein ACFB3T_09345, partial [Geminicoccaceae bacterium]
MLGLLALVTGLGLHALGWGDQPPPSRLLLRNNDSWLQGRDGPLLADGAYGEQADFLVELQTAEADEVDILAYARDHAGRRHALSVDDSGLRFTWRPSQPGTYAIRVGVALAGAPPLLRHRDWHEQIIRVVRAPPPALDIVAPSGPVMAGVPVAFMLSAEVGLRPFAKPPQWLYDGALVAEGEHWTGHLNHPGWHDLRIETLDALGRPITAERRLRVIGRHVLPEGELASIARPHSLVVLRGDYLMRAQQIEIEVYALHAERARFVQAPRAPPPKPPQAAHGLHGDRARVRGDVPAQAGRHGADGQRGGDGAPGSSLMLRSELFRGELSIESAGQAGGVGGRGGDGGDGGDAAMFVSPPTTAEACAEGLAAPAGPGGAGGPGGRGGDGGTITLKIASLAADSRL